MSASTTVSGGVMLVGMGLVTIVMGLFAKHLYNDVDGPYSEEDVTATPKRRDRLVAVCLGTALIGLGIYNLI